MHIARSNLNAEHLNYMKKVVSDILWLNVSHTGYILLSVYGVMGKDLNIC